MSDFIRILGLIIITTIVGCEESVIMNEEISIQEDIELIFPVETTVKQKTINFEWTSDQESFNFVIAENVDFTKVIFDTISNQNSLSLRLPFGAQQTYYWRVISENNHIGRTSFTTDYLGNFIGEREMVFDKECYILYNNHICDSIWTSSIKFSISDVGIHAIDPDSIVYFNLERNIDREKENELHYEAYGYYLESTTSFTFDLLDNKIFGQQDMPCGAGKVINFDFYEED